MQSGCSDGGGSGGTDPSTRAEGGRDLTVQFGKEALVVRVDGDRVLDLKRRLEEATGVITRKQKLIHKGARGGASSGRLFRRRQQRGEALKVLPAYARFANTRRENVVRQRHARRTAARDEADAARIRCGPGARSYQRTQPPARPPDRHPPEADFTTPGGRSQ